MAMAGDMATVPWLSSPFLSHENHVLTAALQISLSNPTNSTQMFDTISTIVAPETGSDLSLRAALPPISGGRVSKRKSRASKRRPVTYITADPANFRRMVQQVTGVRFDGGPAGPAAEPVLRPEPQRLGLGRPVGVGNIGLPTLDTSSGFLFDRVGPAGLEGLVAPVVGEPGSEFGGVVSFPTLESWGVN